MDPFRIMFLKPRVKSPIRITLYFTFGLAFATSSFVFAAKSLSNISYLISCCAQSRLLRVRSSTSHCLHSFSFSLVMVFRIRPALFLLPPRKLHEVSQKSLWMIYTCVTASRSSIPQSHHLSIVKIDFHSCC